MREYNIIHLPKEQWKGHILPMSYTTKEYYDVVMNQTETGFHISVEKAPFPEPVTHTPEEYDFPDRLYEDYRPGACAWGVVIEDELAGVIETEAEEWSNRLRVNELWVADAYQKQGMGHALMELAKEQARQERRRAVMLETQSCNVNAIGFYLHEGFTLIGFDTCCYSNQDLKRKEVRLELGWFPERKPRLAREEIEIREERPEDWHGTEEMTRDAFWNKHQQGCDEHYLVYKLRSSDDYLPKLSRVAVKDGEVIGAILYSKAKVKNGEETREVLTFGPLCVSPKWQGCGVGEALLKETMSLAAEAGYPGIVILGEPDYYPRIGFQTCDRFGITTSDGKNFDAFMGIELIPGAMEKIQGKFYESEVFENLPVAAVEEYDKTFPPKEKQYFPKQWS